jgi:DNA polymerase I
MTGPKMAKKTWLLFDTNYLCHRAFYSMKDLSWQEVKTGVIYGVFRDICTLQSLFNTPHVAFCFDSNRSLRAQVYPKYKSKRRPIEDTDEQENYNEFVRQVRLLRREYLYEIGYRNVFTQKGYEADDVIASLVNTINRKHDVVIVSSDHDLYQLLRPGVCMYNPHRKETVTHEWFYDKYGIGPIQWIDVKAIAGCHTDEIRGIQGVGEITAAKFISGKLKPGSKAYERIVHGNTIWKANINLVQLPYPGCRTFKLQKDEVTKRKWLCMVDSLGMRSMHEFTPIFGSK